MARGYGPGQKAEDIWWVNGRVYTEYSWIFIIGRGILTQQQHGILDVKRKDDWMCSPIIALISLFFNLR